jgi:hypothetical protein
VSYQASHYAAWVIDNSPSLSTRARFVLYVMAETANYETGFAYAGKYVARRTGYDPSNVRKAVIELVKAGVFGVHQVRPGRATRYVFPVVGDAENVVAISPTHAVGHGSTAVAISTPVPGGTPPVPGGTPPVPGGTRTGLDTSDLYGAREKPARVSQEGSAAAAMWGTR